MHRVAHSLSLNPSWDPPLAAQGHADHTIPGRRRRCTARSLTGGRSRLLVLVAVLSCLLVPAQHTTAAVPNACRRIGRHVIGIYLGAVPDHRGTLVISSAGMLRLKMKGGVDPCRGTTAEIGGVVARGSSFPDTLTLDRTRGLDGARLNFHQVWLRGRGDTVRLLGAKTRDRIRMSRFESSSPWLEVFRWDRVGSGTFSDIERVVIQGRGHDDFLVGRPSRQGRYNQPTKIRLRIDAGPGSDRAIGGRRGDSIAGGSGDDLVRGGRGSDRLRAGIGDDRCLSEPADLLITGCEC
jgi:hypothetical protein